MNSSQHPRRSAEVPPVSGGGTAPTARREASLDNIARLVQESTALDAALIYLQPGAETEPLRWGACGIPTDAQDHDSVPAMWTKLIS